LQPSGFTQNVQRTQGIISGQDVILQSLGVITSHSPHDDVLDESGGEEEPHPSSSRSWRGGDALVRQTLCWLPVVPAPARREPAAEFAGASGNQQTQRSDLGFGVRPPQLEPPNAQEFSFASSRSGVRFPLAPLENRSSAVFFKVVSGSTSPSPTGENGCGRIVSPASPFSPWLRLLAIAITRWASLPGLITLITLATPSSVGLATLSIAS
jgi:hypothetical protein